MDKEKILEEFTLYVNMSRSELEKWLSTEEAQSVGWSRTVGKITSPGPEKSEGYKSGLLILEILEKSQADLSESDYKHMRRVNGYIKRHLAQHPNKKIDATRWRYSLMNWGHDPLLER